MGDMAFTVKRTAPTVVTVSVPLANVTMDPVFELLLTSDHHWDNPKCRRDLLKKHFDEAVKRNAGILCFGDFFCAMQGKYDKRADKSSVRPEHQSGDYLDKLVYTAADWLAPYAKNLIMMSPGNHEQAIRKNHETDLMERLVTLLRDRHDSPVVKGTYSGWIRCLFRTGERWSTSRRIWYHHGYGGGGPVTMDTIQAQRQRTYVENADVMVVGHTHDSWAVETVKIRLNDAGAVERRELWQVKTPTYKDECAGEGWHAETGKPPKPLGAYWLKFAAKRKVISTTISKADS
jgi:predicted phosphodiesterase